VALSRASSLPGLTRQSMVRFGYESMRDGLRCGCSAWMPGSSPGMTNEDVKAIYNALLLSFTTAA